MTASKTSTPLLAVIVTVLNEAENILPVCQEIKEALAKLPSTEVIFVDDGSTDATHKKLLDARETLLPNLRILQHPKCLGKSTALRTAIRAARAPWIATMDGDGQDDPNFISTMLSSALSYEAEHASPQPDARLTPSSAVAEASQSNLTVSGSSLKEPSSVGPLVVGVRRKRQDRFSRRFATRFANGLRQRLLNDNCPDTGAPLKLFRRETFLCLPQFEGLHRFIPALMKIYGAPLICIETQHRSRLHGSSKYTNFNRAIVGIRDLLGVMWLLNRTRRLPPYNEL